MHASQAHILAAIVDFRTPHRRHKRGLCTAWLARLAPQPQSPSPDDTSSSAEERLQAPDGMVSAGNDGSSGSGVGSCCTGDRVPVWVSRGVLRMPADHGRPLILVGPGTGVAPFRAFLEERAALQAAGSFFVCQLLQRCSWFGRDAHCSCMKSKATSDPRPFGWQEQEAFILTCSVLFAAMLLHIFGRSAITARLWLGFRYLLTGWCSPSKLCLMPAWLWCRHCSRALSPLLRLQSWAARLLLPWPVAEICAWGGPGSRWGPGHRVLQGG